MEFSCVKTRLTGMERLAVIDVVRHSTKGPDGNLTSEGVTKAGEYGMVLASMASDN